MEGTEQSFQNEESNSLHLSQDETQEAPWQVCAKFSAGSPSFFTNHSANQGI